MISRDEIIEGVVYRPCNIDTITIKTVCLGKFEFNLTETNRKITQYMYVKITNTQWEERASNITQKRWHASVETSQQDHKLVNFCSF